MRKFLIVGLLLTSTFCFPQITIGWERYFGGVNDDRAYSIVQTPDSGFVAIGSSRSFSCDSADVIVVKTKADGGIAWLETYGGNGEDCGYEIIMTNDGNFVFTGRYDGGDPFSGGAVYIAKIEQSGDTLWTRRYTNEDANYSYCIAQTLDEGYIAAGATGAYTTGYFLYVLKIDTDGDSMWTRLYYSETATYARSICLTPDNCYAIACQRISLSTGTDYDAYIVKIDSIGDTLWTRTYGGIAYDDAQCIKPTEDGGFIVVGSRNCYAPTFYDIWVLKLDSYGDTMWTKTYGGSDSEIGRSIAQTDDGGFIITGHTYSYGAGTNDVYLIKTDTFGDTLWTTTFGGSGYEEGNSVIITNEGGYAVAGYTSSYGAGINDVYLIKTDWSGSTLIEKSKEVFPDMLSLCISPNPFNSAVTISFDCGSESAKRLSTIEIFDVNGRMVENISVGAGCIPPAGRIHASPTETIWQPDAALGSGVYLVRAKIGEQSTSKRIVYLK